MLVGDRLKYISLVNLIPDKLIVTELLQEDFTVAKLVEALKAIEQDPKRYETLDAYKNLMAMLQDENISSKIANSIYNRLNNASVPPN